MIDVNVKGTLYAVRAALPHLLESGEADLVTLASEAGPARLPVRGRLLRVEVRAGRLHARARPRAARARRPLHERLPRRRRDRLRPGPRPHAGHAGSPGMMTAEDVAEVVVFVARAAAAPPHPRDGLPADDGGVVGMSAGQVGHPLHGRHQRQLLARRATRRSACDVRRGRSRDPAAAEAYAARAGIARSYGSYEELLADPERRGRLHLAAELAALRVVDPRARGGQARALREAARRASRRRSRGPSTPPSAAGRVLMEAFMWRHNPQTKRLTRARRRRRDRAAAAHPRRVQLLARGRRRTSACTPSSTAAR